MRHFLIDTDTASDDAVALVLALRHPDVTVEAITIVAGNVPIEQGVQNALYTVELCGSHVPVYRGMSAPLLRSLDTAQNVHGGDGMGDIGLPLHGRIPTPGHAVNVIIDTVNRFAGEIEVVTLGPLTNMAMALRQEPSLASKVKRCTIMGGTGQGHGNVTPVSEYNFWADPEAAKIVFEAGHELGLPITMVGWDISRLYAVFTPADAAEIRKIGTPLAEFCMDIQRHVLEFCRKETKLPGFDLPDPIAMAIALDRTIATELQHLYVEIATHDDFCRGQSVVDHLAMTGRVANAEVVLQADHERFARMLYAALGFTGTQAAGADLEAGYRAMAMDTEREAG